MSLIEHDGIAEHCYYEGCDQWMIGKGWITGASDYCSDECEELARCSLDGEAHA